MKKWLQVVQGLSLAACLYTAAAGLMIATAERALALDPSDQCPGNLDPNNNYLGCVNAGAQCSDGTHPGLCGDSPSSTGCTCVRVASPDPAVDED